MRFALTLICPNKKVSSVESHQLHKVSQFNGKHTPCATLGIIKSIMPLPRPSWVLQRGPRVADPPKSSSECAHGAALGWFHTQCLPGHSSAHWASRAELCKEQKHAHTCYPETYKIHWNALDTVPNEHNSSTEVFFSRNVQCPVKVSAFSSSLLHLQILLCTSILPLIEGKWP